MTGSERLMDVSRYLIKHLKELGAGLMNGADDCPSTLRQRLHERHHLEAGRAVQTAETGQNTRDRRLIWTAGQMTQIQSS